MRGRLSKVSQERRLYALATIATKLRPSYGVENRSLVQSTAPLKPTKRSPYVRRARVTQAEAQNRPLRRSARLQGKQPASGGGSVRSSRASLRPQIAEMRPLERPVLNGKNAQLEAEDILAGNATIGVPRATAEDILGVQHPKPSEPSEQPYIFPLETRAEEQQRLSPATRWRERPLDGDGGENEYQQNWAPLTLENLANFNKMVKKQGGANQVSTSASASGPEYGTESLTSKNTWEAMSSFAVQVQCNGVLAWSSKPPANLKELRERCHQSRGSAFSPPTRSAYENYVDKVEAACNDSTLAYLTSMKVLKEHQEKGYYQVFNQRFTGFPEDIGFNNGLYAPRPDFVEGLERVEYRPFPVGEHLEAAVLYENDPRSLVLAHLAGEMKGHGKGMEQARARSAYAGAALVYARNQALSYLGKLDLPGHAEVITFTTDGITLSLYAHYAAESEYGILEHHQYPIMFVNLIGSYEGFEHGQRALRNAQDYARERSYALRDQLKEHWRQHRDGN